MNNVYKLFALIMENLGQVAGKIDGLYSLQSNINTLANINTELTTIGNRLDALEGGE